jgi:hypothetical protein
MKLWKTLLIAISVAILPFALVGVGQAQQLTCWGLRPNLTQRTDRTEFSEPLPPQQCEESTERKSEICHDAEDEDETENVGSS